MEWKVVQEKNKNDEGMKKAYGRRRDVTPLGEGGTPR